MPDHQENKDILRDFKWIQEEASSDRPVFEETSVTDRTLSSLLLKKFSENAFVPIGLFATTACLFMGLASMVRGQVQQQQMFMRGRVAFQALTFVAMGSGVLATTLKKKRDSKDQESAKNITTQRPA